ncbi:DUF6670 family protein [Acinetobacter sp. XH1741]|uniref:DUF6670 family protein n=1 Tax=unclassified Acinetobacter TaxID=196816 RepID=UPI0032B4EFD6
MREQKSSILSKCMGGALIGLKPIADSASSGSVAPFKNPQIMIPRFNDNWYCWSHFGLFFSDLPEPHRFLNIMILFGTPGAMAFDHDYLVKNDSPRTTATLFSGTAACSDFLLKGYIINEECHANADGSDITFGQELKIEGKYPHVKLIGNYAGLDIDIQVDITDQVSYFTKSFIYDHLSLLATYEGRIIFNGQETPVKGLCTYEYARAFGLYSLKNRPIDYRHKIPLNFFTYQILKIDQDIQVLLTKAEILGVPVCYCIHVRRLNQSSEYYDDVKFEVLEYYEQEKVGLNGGSTKVPKKLSWIAKDKQGNVLLSILGDADTEYHYGHGVGYSTCYKFHGEFENRPIEGRCYMEYVDIPY